MAPSPRLERGILASGACSKITSSGWETDGFAFVIGGVTLPSVARTGRNENER